jgi:hypothetical protein
MQWRCARHPIVLTNYCCNIITLMDNTANTKTRRQTRVLTKVSHGTNSILRSSQSLSYSRISQYFMEPEGSVLCSKDSAASSYRQTH